MINRIAELGIPEHNIAQDEPMYRHTSFRVGGCADIFVTCCNEDELAKLLGMLDETGERHMLIGNGSNLLFSDEGYRGVLIGLGGDFDKIEIIDDVIVAGSSVLLSRVSSVACENALTGIEFAGGIPGSIGGAMYMDAGAYGGEMRDIVSSVRLMSPDGDRIFERSNSEMEFTYRHSAIQDDGSIVISARLQLAHGDRKAIRARITELNEKRNSKQPINFPSAGSTFKRPVGGYAAALIEEAGLKGETVGGAEVSTKHSGFIINRGGATCADILELIDIVEKRVFEDSGIRLEPEVRIIPAEEEADIKGE